MILIVEDDIAHIELIRRAFEDAEQGMEVRFVSSIAAALACIRQTLPQLVITDLLLPDGRGTDLIPEDREAAPFPVVVMTSHGDERVAVEAMKAGALDYVVKSPIAFMELPRTALRSIREWGHIQARRAAESAVRQSEERLRAFLDAAAQGVIVADAQGHIQYVNRQMALMFGYSPEELLCRDAAMLFAGGCREHYTDLIADYLADPGENPIRLGVQFEGMRRDGARFPASLSLNLMEFNGEVQMIALVADVTGQKLLEAQAAEAERMELALAQEKELRRYKDHFLSMMSHEFRTPLAVIRSSNDILKKYYDRLTEDKRRQNFHRIEAKVEELDAMIADILLLTKSEMNLLEFRPQPTHLPHFLQEIVETVHKARGQNRVDLHVDLSQETYPIDPYLLQHALNNLLDNAIKYSAPDTPVHLNVSNGSGRIAIEISDHGIGIAPEELTRVFQPFQRGSNVGQIEGTGVGLAIVREFITIHGGDVTCQSQINQGTSFRIELPL